MTGIVVLVVAGLLLIVLALVTARRPEHEIPDKDGYFDKWSVLHGGYDPRTGNVWLRGWLTMVYRIARPLARRGIQPDVLTISSIWLAGAVFVPADIGGRWAMLAGWTFAVAIFSRHLPSRMLARVLGVMGLVSSGFLLCMLLTSNPFDRLIPPADDGRDLVPRPEPHPRLLEQAAGDGGDDRRRLAAQRRPRPGGR